MTFGISFMGHKWIPIPLQMDEKGFEDLMFEWARQHPQLANDLDQVRLTIAQLNHENNLALKAHKQEAQANAIFNRYSFRNSQAR